MKKTALKLSLVLALALGAGILSACQPSSAGSTGSGSSAATSAAASDAATPAVRTISGAEAIELMKSESDYVIVDVRTESEYAEGHVPGAMLIPLDTISGSEVAELPNKDQLIMLYCRSGNRSGQAAGIMEGMGYTTIVDFGGIIDWPGEIETGLPAAAAA